MSYLTNWDKDLHQQQSLFQSISTTTTTADSINNNNNNRNNNINNDVINNNNNNNGGDGGGERIMLMKRKDPLTSTKQHQQQQSKNDDNDDDDDDDDDTVNPKRKNTQPPKTLADSKSLSFVFSALKGTQITIHLRNNNQIYGTIYSIDKHLNIELSKATIRIIKYNVYLENENQLPIPSITTIDYHQNIYNQDDDNEQQQGNEDEEYDINQSTGENSNNSTTTTAVKYKDDIYELIMVNSKNIRYIHIPDRIDLNHLLYVYSKTLTMMSKKYQRTKRKPQALHLKPDNYVHDNGSSIFNHNQQDMKNKKLQQQPQ